MGEGMLDRVRAEVNALQISKSAAAAAIGLEPSKLSKVLNGKRRISSLELALLAQLTGRSVDWFLTGEKPRSWRVAARATEQSRAELNKTGEAVIKLIAERWDGLTVLGDLPVIPARPERADTSRYLTQASKMAEGTLKMLSAPVGGLSNAELIENLEEDLGIQVIITGLPAGIDGLSYQDGDLRVVVLRSTSDYYRQRFTFAHEIGHLFWGDAMDRVIAETMWDSKAHEESRANSFAASLLMPRDEIVEFVGSSSVQEEFDALVWHFQVSPAALGYRLMNLHMISDTERKRLSRPTTATAAERDGKSIEFMQRSDAAKDVRPPWRLVALYLEAYDRGDVTLRPVADLLGWSLDEVEARYGDALDE